jgi:hypothetical protein
LTKAEKFSAKFDVLRLKRVMPAPGLDVNASLQVKTGSLHNSPAFGRDLHNRDHVKLFDSLASFRRKLPCIRRILLNLDDDHVKLRAELPCTDAIRSGFVRNFLAQTRSRQTLTKTSSLRRDQVVIGASR